MAEYIFSARFPYNEQSIFSMEFKPTFNSREICVSITVSDSASKKQFVDSSVREEVMGGWESRERPTNQR